LLGGFAHAAAELLEGGHGVGLLLDVELVHLLLGQVDDGTGPVVQGRLAIPFHRDLLLDPFLRGLAEEEVQQAALELDRRLVARLAFRKGRRGGQRDERQGDQRQPDQAFHSVSSRKHSDYVLLHSANDPPGQTSRDRWSGAPRTPVTFLSSIRRAIARRPRGSRRGRRPRTAGWC